MILPSSATTRYSFHYDGERRVMRQEAIADPWSPEQALAAAAGATLIYLAALTRTDFPLETIAALANGGRRLLIDAHGLVRTPALGALVVDAEIGAVLRHVTFLKLNDEEAEILSGGTDEDAVRSLEVPEVLLTLGSQGSLVVAGDVAARIEATPIDGRVDPTGAGDMFSAAYLDERSRGTSPGDAARQASGLVSELILG